MSTTNNNPQDEVLLLRQANAELTEKSRTRKTKIAELESCVTDLQGKLTAAEMELQDLKIGTPLRQLAATVSPVPELWMMEFQKHFKLELRDGKLTVLDATGEVVMDGKEPLEFNADKIGAFVTDKSKELSVFSHISYGSKASGGGANSANNAESSPALEFGKRKPTEPTPSPFGLR